MNNTKEVFTSSIDFISKIFATNYPDIEEFQPSNINTWIKLINQIPRIPYLLIVEIFCSCFLIRSLLNFRKPIFSLICSLIICSMTENLSSVLRNRKLAIFENYLISPFTLIAWQLINYFPFDLVYKLFHSLSLLIYIFNGFMIGHDITLGIDEAIYMYPESSIYAILFGIAFGASRHIAIYIFGRALGQNVPSAGPIIFESSLGALAYYYLTDLGHISYSFWYDKELMRLVVIISMSVFGLINFFVPGEYFTKLYDIVEKCVFFFIPYYGSKWYPRRSFGHSTNPNGSQESQNPEKRKQLEEQSIRKKQM